jgi:hypothetical protein
MIFVNFDSTIMGARQSISCTCYTEPTRPHPDTICRRWSLDSPIQYLIIPPDHAEKPRQLPDMIYHLAQLSLAMYDEHATAVCELLEVRHLRLGRYPESGRDLCAQDVRTVYIRQIFLKKTWHSK